jgi:hypothetical protein
VPLSSYGNIGDYAVVATNVYNPIYYKRGGPTTSQAPNWIQDSLSAGQLSNTWVQIGSSEWQTAWAALQGVQAPTSLTVGNAITINGVNVTVASSPNNTVQHLAGQINTALNNVGVYAANIGGYLNLYATSEANSGAGTIVISNYAGTPLTTLGITAGTYNAPAYDAGPNYTAPRWRTTDTTPEPTGSVFQQTNAVNQGMLIEIKRYDSTLGTFVLQSCPAYGSDAYALYYEDPTTGGQSIPVGTTYAQWDPLNNSTAGLLILERVAAGATAVTGANVNPTFTTASTFSLSYTTAGTTNITNPVTVTVNSLNSDPATTADFQQAVSAAVGLGSPVSVEINSAGALVFNHATGGDIYLVDGTHTPLVAAGFTTSVTGIRNSYVSGTANGLILSNWVGSPTFTYIAAGSPPEVNPVNGTLWYDSNATTADIMIQDNGEWMGYQNVTNDVRGYDLSLTNAAGPIFSVTAPTTQTNTAQSPLAYGDLWINTADLENYPIISRWENVNGQDQWVTINNTDQTTINGILFADARWAPNGTTNPISDPIPPIATGATPLITSDYLDLDAPDPLLYPQGTLLWNTRRSGFNVKSFEVNYFNATTYPYPDVLPSQTNAWVTASGNRADGTPNMGRHAQRALIVKSLRAAIDSSTQLREQQAQYNLIACPQYPELAPNMVVLNNDRGDTAFNVVDTPLRLTPTDIVAWATNNNGLGQPYGDGNLATGSAYSGAFYPSCTTNDLSGNIVVTAPSHMMLRTIIRSDSVAYPWFAPAGLRRGVVDNALQIGYLNATTGAFTALGVNQGLRDVLYMNDVNPITFIPGTGIVNFGNHTLQGTATALDRINVARLVAYLRGRLEIIGNQYLFEPNDTITRSSIQTQISSLMVDLVNKRGLYDYLVVCDTTNNTPATIDANELYVDIAIEPVKAVEFIYIPMRIQRTGTIAGQATA